MRALGMPGVSMADPLRGTDANYIYIYIWGFYIYIYVYIYIYMGVHRDCASFCELGTALLRGTWCLFHVAGVSLYVEHRLEQKQADR